MPSKESEALYNLFKNLMDRMAANPNMDLETRRLHFECVDVVGAEPTDVTYENVKCPGTVRDALWCKPLSASPSHVILFFHGGGFATGSPYSHRKVAGHLAKAAGCHALVTDYRLSPENAFPAAVDDCISAYRWLVEDRGILPKNIATAGDSAGGNLAVSSVLKMREQNLPLPAATIGISPWVDFELKGQTMKTNAKTDPLTMAEGMEQMIQIYLGGEPTTHPIANPLHADHKGMPPMYLTAGTYESLQDNATMLADKAKEAGVEVEVEMGEGMQHVYVWMAGKAPEADKTIANIGKWTREKLGVKG